MYRKLLIWLLLASIFLDDYLVGGNGADIRAKMPFDLYYYYFFFILGILHFIISFKSIKLLPSYFVKIIILFFAGGIIGAVQAGNIGFTVLKQILGILFSAMAYYSLIRIAQFDLEGLFKKYVNLALIVSLIGVIEEIIYLLGFTAYFDNVKRMSIGLYRVYSIMGEPYFLAVAIVPALFYLFNRLFGIKSFRQPTTYHIISFLIIFACFILTFSTGGAIGLGLMFVLVLYNRLGKKIYVVFPAIILYIALNFQNFSIGIYEIRVRIEDTVKGIAAGGNLNKKELSNLNSSSFALVSNLIIAQQSIALNPIFGCGIGNHEHLSNKLFTQLFGKDFLVRFGNFNAKDANSLFIRMMSEGGFLGVLLLAFIYFKPFVFRKGIADPTLQFYTVINQACFIMFTIRIVRTGNYISQGFMFFLFLYVITYIKLKKPHVILPIKALPS